MQPQKLVQHLYAAGDYPQEKAALLHLRLCGRRKQLQGTARANRCCSFTAGVTGGPAGLKQGGRRLEKFGKTTAKDHSGSNQKLEFSTGLPDRYLQNAECSRAVGQVVVSCFLLSEQWKSSCLVSRTALLHICSVLLYIAG